jgi:UDP-N-acetylglucosamine 2-epimerase
MVGEQPNFLKAAPMMVALEEHSSLQAWLVHTSQHFDANLSNVFFTQLGMTKPDVYSDIHDGCSALQVELTVMAPEKIGTAQLPHLVVVFGDEKATMPAA